MLLQHEGELVIGIGHWAALVVEGDRYCVVLLEGKHLDQKHHNQQGK
jgi:hypothetical protein